MSTMTNEQWRDVLDWEGQYQVSDQGRVKSLVSNIPGLIRASVKGTAGYRRVMLKAGGRRKMYCIHILVDRAFRGPMPDGLEVNHDDGDKTNNRLLNLVRMTRSENVKHSFRTGLRTHQGAKNPSAVLNDDKVRALIAELGPRTPTGRLPYGAATRLASKYGIKRDSIYRIAAGRAWTHLT